MKDAKALLEALEAAQPSETEKMSVAVETPGPAVLNGPRVEARRAGKAIRLRLCPVRYNQSLKNAYSLTAVMPERSSPPYLCQSFGTRLN